MKVKKILTVLIFIVMLLNLLIPTAALAVNEVERQLENVEKQDEKDKILQENQDELDEDLKEDEEGKQIIDYINNSKNSETLVDEGLESNLKNLDNKEQEVETEDDGILNQEFSISVDVSGYKINTYFSDDIHYLFLPQGVDIKNLLVNYTGNITSVSIGKIDEQNKTINVDFSTTDTMIIVANDISYTIKVLQTDLPSISISLKDITLNELNTGNKDTKYKGNTVILKDPNNSEYDFIDTDVEIKGRGNFTWKLDKKPYQIKLSSKTDVLGMGKDKKWILLANHADNSLMRNKIAFELAKEIGLDYTQNSRWIDLWIDGEYQGNYLICEKVELGSKRVDLNDDNGVLVEIDNNYYQTEDLYFKAKLSDTAFVLKESVADDVGEENSQSEKAFEEIETYINEFEKLLYSDNKDWEKISSMIDVESFVKFYFMQEFTEDPDGCRSSLYMYRDGEDDVLHIGPVWDYDSSLGNYTAESFGGNTNVDYVMNIKNYMEYSNDWYSELLKIKEFRKLVIKNYNDNIKTVLESVEAKIDTYKTTLAQSEKINFIRWKTLGTDSVFGKVGHKIEETYEEEVDYLMNWAIQRIKYLDERYDDESNIFKVKYKSHVQDYGWKDYVEDGEISGTEEQSKRIEAIQINLDTFNSNFQNATIKYQAHVQDHGWMSWKQEGQIAGTQGESKRIEAIKIKLENLEEYTVKYRVHVQDYGWMDWKKDGEIAGTEGESKRIEAIQIQIVKNPKIEVNYTYNPDKNTVTATITSDKELSSINDTSWKLSEDKLTYTKEYSENDTYKIKVKDIDGIEKEIEVKITQIVEPISLVKYNSHIQDYGWERKYSKIDGQTSGTSGENKRIESIKIALGNSKEIPENANIKYQVHVQDYGWMDWKQNGEIAGTEGQSKRIEAFKIKLEGMENYSVEYRVHIQDIGWQKWKKNGETAGTEGQLKRIEAIEIRIVESDLVTIEPEVSYQAHVQDIGWQNQALEGAIAGTEGQAKRVEALKINLSDVDSNAKIKYRAHVQDIGWQAWVRNGAIAGTEGKEKRIEAIQIELENMEDYTVEYKVHIQDYGWSDWMIDGETAGTTGKGKRIEAIKIRIVPKYYREYKGIDVSEFNGVIDWQKVKKSGVQFAMIRCGYRGYRTGKIVTDPQFEYNIQNASAAGIDVGIYFFSQATSISEAVEEANYAIGLAKKYDCITYPIAIDTEMSGADNNDGRADGLDAALRTNVVAAFCNQVQNNGYTPMVYASRDWLYNNLEIDRLSIYDTWLAHYTGSTDKKSDYKYDYTMWQYTSSGSIPGIGSERVDLNIGYKKY